MSGFQFYQLYSLGCHVFYMLPTEHEQLIFLPNGIIDVKWIEWPNLRVMVSVFYQLYSLGSHVF